MLVFHHNSKPVLMLQPVYFLGGGKERRRFEEINPEISLFCGTWAVCGISECMKRQLILWFFATNTVLKGHSWQGLWEHLLLGTHRLNLITENYLSDNHHNPSLFIIFSALQEICTLFPSFLLANKHVRRFSVWQWWPQNHLFQGIIFFLFCTAKWNTCYFEAYD